MPATCVPQYVPRANTGLSKHGDPVFPHFWSWNQNLPVFAQRGGGTPAYTKLPIETFFVLRIPESAGCWGLRPVCK